MLAVLTDVACINAAREIFVGFNFHRWSIFTYHNFHGLIFTDAWTHAHYVLYSQAYFADIILGEIHENWTPQKLLYSNSVLPRKFR